MEAILHPQDSRIRNEEVTVWRKVKGPVRNRSTQGGDMPSRSDRRWPTTVVLLAMVGTAAIAQVQDTPPPAVEIAGGYQFSGTLRDIGAPGWFVSAARPVGDRTAIVIEIADTRGRRSSPVYG